MTDPLFFVFIVISILGYGIHLPLIALYARKFNSLVTTVYRNLSFIILIVPLLFFVPFSEIVVIKEHLLILALASVTGFVSFMFSLTGMRYLPVGISNAIARTFNVLFAVVLGALFFSELLTPLQLLLLSGILLGAVMLSVLRSQHAHLDTAKMWSGTVFSIVAGIGVSVSFFLFGVLSREVNPLVASYFWEVGVGVCALFWLLFQYVQGRYEGPILLPLRDALSIAGVSLFVVAGTVGLSFAVNHGPFALAIGISTTIVLVTTLISWYLFKEYLSKLQVALILFVVLLMFLLRVFS